MQLKYASFDLVKSIIDTGNFALRRIPEFQNIIVEKRHLNEYPDGKIVYLDEYKREMCVCKRKLKYGGQWTIISKAGTAKSINIFSDQYLIKNINEVLQYINNTPAS